MFGFGHYVVDLARGAVRAGDRVLDLRPKTFLVLAYLVEHAGRLVPKDEIMQAVWPDLVVSDESLAKCISEIRIALGDQDQRLLKTVPRRGYLLDVPVSATNGAPRTALPEPAGEPAGTDKMIGNRAVRRFAGHCQQICRLAMERPLAIFGEPIDGDDAQPIVDQLGAAFDGALKQLSLLELGQGVADRRIVRETRERLRVDRASHQRDELGHAQ